MFYTRYTPYTRYSPYSPYTPYTPLYTLYRYVFECTVFAFSAISQSKAFFGSLIEFGVEALLAYIISGKINRHVLAEEVCRIFYQLTMFINEETEGLEIAMNHVVLAFRLIYYLGICNQDAALLIVLTLRNFARLPTGRAMLLESDAYRYHTIHIAHLSHTLSTVLFPPLYQHLTMHTCTHTDSYVN